MQIPYLNEVRHIQRDAWKVMIVSVVVGLGYFGIHTVVFNLYLLRLGYGPEFIGLFNGLAMFAAALCAIPAGMAGRKWGLRPVMLTGYVMWTVMSVLLPQAELVPPAWRSGWLLVTFTITWMAVPLWGVNQTTYLYWEKTVDRRKGYHAHASLLSYLLRQWTLFSSIRGLDIGGKYRLPDPDDRHTLHLVFHAETVEPRRVAPPEAEVLSDNK